jgi:hypothetical protein
VSLVQLDGEPVVLDDAGHPLFNELLFGRRRPTYGLTWPSFS